MTVRMLQKQQKRKTETKNKEIRKKKLNYQKNAAIHISIYYVKCKYVPNEKLKMR